MNPEIQKIIIHPSVLNSTLARRVIENRGNVPFETAETVPDISLTSGKRILFIRSLPGQLVKPCPATSSPYLCCQYTVIHSCLQCPMDCTYCVLQNYLESPVITLNVRLMDMFGEIDHYLKKQPGRYFRFGTGELGDSLALDPLTELSRDFTGFFNRKRNALIELKTKSVHIRNVLDCSPSNVVVSWSVNPGSVVRSQEIHAPALEARLQAARQCQDAGFLLGFHFDPILHVEHWERLYQEVVDQIFSAVSADRIAWISLGSLRFPPALKPVVQARFPGSSIVYEEMIRGQDGKMRYPKPMRLEMYRSVYDRIRFHAPDVFVYFCMELPQVWDRVMGNHPENNAELDFRFAESLYRRFGSELAMDPPDLKHYPVVK